jgi:hypothetical protein
MDEPLRLVSDQAPIGAGAAQEAAQPTLIDFEDPRPCRARRTVRRPLGRAGLRSRRAAPARHMRHAPRGSLVLPHLCRAGRRRDGRRSSLRLSRRWRLRVTRSTRTSPGRERHLRSKDGLTGSSVLAQPNGLGCAGRGFLEVIHSGTARAPPGSIPRTVWMVRNPSCR